MTQPLTTPDSKTSPLDYASPGAALPPPDLLRRASLWMSVFAGAIGVGILILFLMFESELLIAAGFGWLMIGGALSATAMVIGIIYFAIGMYRKFPAPSSRRRGACVMLLPIVNVVLAIGCVVVGRESVERASRVVYVYNGGSSVMSLRLNDGLSFSRDIKDLKSGEVAWFRYPATGGQMTAVVSTPQGQVSYTVVDYMGRGSDWGVVPRWVRIDDLTGYYNETFSVRPSWFPSE
jgi:hypothetical protein